MPTGGIRKGPACAPRRNRAGAVLSVGVDVDGWLAWRRGRASESVAGNGEGATESSQRA